MDDKSVKHDNDNCRCPACNSTKTVEIPENERVMGYGLYLIQDFIGSLFQDQKYKCHRCGYRWGDY